MTVLASTIAQTARGKRFDPSGMVFHCIDGCFSIALALLLDVACETVPNFCRGNPEISYVIEARNWVAEEHGLSLIHFLIPWPPWAALDNVLRDLNIVNPGVPFIASGASHYKDGKPTAYHAVLCCDGKIVLDPSGAGIRGGYAIDGGIPDLIIFYLGGPISAAVARVAQERTQ
jgi:hypothetical protein